MARSNQENAQEDGRNAGLGSTAAQGIATEPFQLNVRCPQCQHAVELSQDQPFHDVSCRTCGAAFSLIDESDRTFQVSRNEMINHFRLLDRLGAGSFGSVWSAFDTQLDRMVALKIPRKGQLSREEAEFFVREAKAVAQLKHPNIVQVYEVGRHKDRIYISCELIRGVDLAEWLEVRRPTVREAASICATLADALEHAHDRGVVHRDIKPSNVMLDDEEIPHLMDFGLAKRDANEVTMTTEGRLLGTPAYMSPEQARGAAHDADARSDIYSLGVLLFELLTGERPFRGSTRMLLHQVLNEDANSPRTLNSNVPRDLETVCLKCLEKAPNKRYQSAAALRDDLRRFIHNEPVLARRITRFEKGFRWCRRRPLLTAVSLLLMTSIVTGLIAVSFFWQRAEGAAFLANEAARRADVNSQTANSNLYKALLREAKALRLARVPGYRQQVFDSVVQASQLTVPERKLQELRNEAAACLGDFAGIQPQVTQGFRSRLTALDVHPESNMVVCGLHSGEIALFDSSHPGQEVVYLGSPGNQSVEKIRVVSPAEFVAVYRPLDETTEEANALRWLARGGSWQSAPIEAPATGLVIDVAFDRSAQVGAFAMANSTIHVFDQGTTERRFEIEVADQVKQICVGPNGRLLAASFVPADSLDSPPTAIHLWNLESEERIGTVAPSLDIINEFCFGSEGRLLACACGNGFAVFDCDSQTKIIEQQGFSSHHVVLGRDGLLACTDESRSMIVVWDAASNRKIAEFPAPSQFASIRFADGSRELIAAGDKSVFISPLVADDEKLMLLGHQSGVPGVAFSPSGTTLVSSGKDNTIRRWNSESGRQERVLQGLVAGGESIDFHPSGKFFVTGDLADGIQIWDAVDETAHEKVQGGIGPMIWSVRFSPDGDYLAACAINGVALWNVKTTSTGGLELVPMEVLDTREAYAVGFDATGRYLVWSEWIPSESADDLEAGYARIRVWDIVTRREVNGPSAKLPAPGNKAFAVRQSDNCMVFVSLENQIESWSFEKRELGQAISLGDPTSSNRGATESDLPRSSAQLALHPNGRLLALESRTRGPVEIWDLENRRQLVELPSSGGVTWSMVWSPSRNQLAVARSQGSLAVWDLDVVERQLETLGLTWKE